MKEIKLTQNKVALVDDEDYEYLNQWKWSAQKNYNTYYARRSKYVGRINGKSKYKGILMHRVIMNTPDGMDTDHINHNGLDNRKENLRVCTCQQNQMNRTETKNNLTGFKGVYLKNCYTKEKKYRYITSSIKVDGVNKHLGMFKTEEEAALAYNKAAIKYYGEFAKLNDIQSKSL